MVNVLPVATVPPVVGVVVFTNSLILGLAATFKHCVHVALTSLALVVLSR